jgi:hypothetical protein
LLVDSNVGFREMNPKVRSTRTNKKIRIAYEEALRIRIRMAR